jgi:hypothetical protein
MKFRDYVEAGRQALVGIVDLNRSGAIEDFVSAPLARGIARSDWREQQRATTVSYTATI